MVINFLVCFHLCQVEAIRVKFNHGIVDKKGKENLLHKYLSGNSKFGLNHKLFDESKRKVPSCPDPLHN